MNVAKNSILPLQECEEASRVLKALAHPQRLRMLCLLSGGEKTVSELEKSCEASQSAISQFLNRMKSEGLVSCRREGSFVFYRISDPRIQLLVRSMHKIFCP